MRRSISKRPLRTKAVAGVLAVAAVAATASLAGAQAVAPAPDGGPDLPPVATQAITTTCGALTSNTIVTHNGPRTTNATAFQNIPGTTGRFVVPDGQTRCVKLLFTAESACGLSGGPDFCYVQGVIDGQPMNPNGAGFQALDSEHATAGARAYEWVKRVGPGVHTIAVQWRVLAAGTQMYIDDSTTDWELHL